MVPAELLQGVYLFRGASPEDLVALAAVTDRKEFLAGDYVYRAGDAANALFHIEMGTVDIVNPGTQMVFATLGAGQTFGEMSFFDGGARAADARTHELSRVFRIPLERLGALLTARPGLALVVYRNGAAFLAKHMRQLALDRNQRYF